jgi:ribosomal protein S18 acetylase RimI-like enzyme
MNSEPCAFSVREATVSEAQDLAAFAWRVFDETFREDLGCVYPAHDLAVFRAEAYQPELFARWIASPDYGVWVAEAEGEFLAYAVAGPCSFDHPLADPAHGELKRLYVARQGQGRGVAPVMLRQALDGLAARGRSTVLLSVWSGNHRAQAFYRRQGFQIIAEFKFPVGQTMDDEFLMRWG